jgi:NarL family two-component system sensor histidine kinase LiaS
MFRSLRWKLTRTYTLVTTSALLTAGVVLLALMGAIIQPGEILRDAVRGMGNGLASMTPMQTALRQTPPDSAAIQVILSNLPNWYTKPPLTAAALESGETPGGLLVIVTDNQGRIVAALPPLAEAGLLGTPLSGTPARLAVSTLNGIKTTDETAPGWMGTAQPVLSDQTEEVLGAVVVIANLKTLTIQAAWIILGLAGGVLLVLTFVSGVVGTLFGFIATRGITRRLAGLAQASAAWRQGDFSASAADSSGDEIGQLSADLNFMAADLRNLFEARQELAAIAERNRIARDLHDSIKQQAFAIAAQVSAARALLETNPSAAQTRLSEAEQLSNQLRQELSALVRELYSADVLAAGLPAALRELATTWARQNNLVAEIEISEEFHLPEPISLTLYRVAQEALANIARHAGAHHIWVTLRQESDGLTLQIRDDGRGFDPETIQPGVGLRSMRERLATLGGEFTLVSAPGEGTIITVKCQDRLNEVNQDSPQSTRRVTKG